jgi:glutamate 5-kinase
LNAQNTFVELFNMGVIPIVNENDTLAVSVRTSVMTCAWLTDQVRKLNLATMIPSQPLQRQWFADYLFLMTDVDCLYDKNPELIMMHKLLK